MGIILSIAICVGFYFLSRWIVRKMFEIRASIDEIEVPNNFFEKLLVRFVKSVFITADRLSNWLGKQIPWLASPVVYTPVRNLIQFGITGLAMLFFYLSSKLEGINAWSILGYVLLSYSLFDWVVPKQSVGDEKRIQDDLTRGEFLVYFLLFSIIILLLLFVIIMVMGWAIASNSESSPSSNAAEVAKTETNSEESQSNGQQMYTVNYKYPSGSAIIDECQYFKFDHQPSVSDVKRKIQSMGWGIDTNKVNVYCIRFGHCHPSATESHPENLI